MKNYYFTFGQGHAQKDGTEMKNYWVRVCSNLFIEARLIFMDKFSSVFMPSSTTWGFQYEEKDFDKSYYPLGEYAYIDEAGILHLLKPKSDLTLYERNFMMYVEGYECDSFTKSLIETIFKADTRNQEKLRLVFPGLVEIVHLYRTQSGYYEKLKERWQQQFKS